MGDVGVCEGGSTCSRKELVGVFAIWREAAVVRWVGDGLFQSLGPIGFLGSDQDFRFYFITERKLLEGFEHNLTLV